MGYFLFQENCFFLFLIKFYNSGKTKIIKRECSQLFRIFIRFNKNKV